MYYLYLVIKRPRELSDLHKETTSRSQKLKAKSLSRVPLFLTQLTVTYQAPLPMGFSRQEYWSGLPFPSPGDLPDPGIKPRSGLITSWQIEGKKMEVVTDFLFGGSKITADGDCSHGIIRHLLLGRKAMTNLYSVEKQRQYCVKKGPYSQGCGLPSGYIRL